MVGSNAQSDPRVARIAAIVAGASTRATELETLLAACDDAYYERDAPLVSDIQYDLLAEIARTLTGERHQELGGISTELVSVPHAHPVLSLQKAYTMDEIIAFLASAARGIGRDDEGVDLHLLIEPKLDGLTLVLEYRDGALVRALTRGNGRVGEDVTHNARGLAGIPACIPAPGTTYVRGEAFLPLSRFAALRVAGEDVATPRNTAAGDIRRKSTGGDACRAQRHGVTFLSYQIEGDGATDLATQDDMRARLTDWGFLPLEYREVVGGPVAGESLDAPESPLGLAIVDLLDTLEGAAFAMDGLVLKLVDRAIQRRLGATEKTPRWAIAVKMIGEEYTTTVRGVHWQVGRVGQVTPVLVCDPVDMDGAQVRNYTAHHAAFYRDLGAAVGSRVRVTRAGDVIPKVLGLLEGETRHDDLPLPTACLGCGNALTLRNTKVLECRNATCPPKARKALRHFAARDNMDIAGLGTEIVEALVGSARIASPADLYALSVEDIAALPLANGQFYGATRAQKLHGQIAATRGKPFSVLLHALGASGVGYPECRAIAGAYGLSDLLALARSGALTVAIRDLHGVGPATAASLQGFLADNTPWIASLAGRDVQVAREAAPAAVGGPLSDKSFVVTGALEMGSREDAEALIRAHGGAVSSSVSAKTTYLVAGVKPGGSKMTAARKHGTTVIDEQGLRSLLS